MAEYVCDMTDDYPDVPYDYYEYIYGPSVREEQTGRGKVVMVTPASERRERIVRCRDCKHAEPMPLSYSERLICAYLDDMSVEPDGFCKWGAPREVAGYADE